MANALVTNAAPTGPFKARVIDYKTVAKGLTSLMLAEDEDKSFSTGPKRELQTAAIISDTFCFTANDFVPRSPLPSSVRRKPFLVYLRLRI